MAEKWYPVIDFDKCSNCLVCVEHCKHGVYDKGKDIPTVILPVNCIDGCRGCQKKCPEEAISYFGDDGSRKESSCCGTQVIT